MDSNTPLMGKRGRTRSFESFLGRPARIAAGSNMWGPLVPALQYLGATRCQSCLAPLSGRSSNSAASPTPSLADSIDRYRLSPGLCAGPATIY